MLRSEIHDHTKSGQLRQRGRNWIKTEPMMMMTLGKIKKQNFKVTFVTLLNSTVCSLTAIYHFQLSSDILQLNFHSSRMVDKAEKKKTSETSPASGLVVRALAS